MIRVRLVADDVAELHAAAAAIGQALTVTRTSQPVPRRCGVGVSLYLDARLRDGDDSTPGPDAGVGEEGRPMGAGE